MKENNLKTLLRSFLALLILFSNLVSAEYVENLKIKKVVDGDTVHAFSSSGLHKIRLTEIDAPEVDKPGGLESKAYLSALLVDGVIDVEFFGKDMFQRDLGRIYDNDRDINRMMVQAGMAWVHDKYVTDKTFYLDQNEAKSNRLGVWGKKNFVFPEYLKKEVDMGTSTQSSSKECCRICKKGKACGDGCINKAYKCKKRPGCACNQ